MEDEKARDPFGFKLKRKEQGYSEEPGQKSEFFDRFMFGGKKSTDVSKDQPTEPAYPFSKYLDHIDLDEVMHHVDTLITSSKELKPLFGKIKPFFDQIIDKK
ncbi:hypothetical protein [Mesobacillus subterraneus]|uniref:Uncharacterized protein n=1 Tax=Mesobacillus subterraneus TaxID=285983 RepID=A0A0D6ZBQ3_9BACI|nr:hypothetical protein [Mesobacillus subterraneus]KIY22952.1 hypothetical protein UB32_05515 [Mesobacillus subterraneus]